MLRAEYAQSLFLCLYSQLWTYLAYQCGVFITDTGHICWTYFITNIGNCLLHLAFKPANSYLFKANNRNTWKKVWNFQMLIKTPKRHQWWCSGVFIVNFEHVLHFFSSVSIFDCEQVNVWWVPTFRKMNDRRVLNTPLISVFKMPILRDRLLREKFIPLNGVKQPENHSYQASYKK